MSGRDKQPNPIPVRIVRRIRRDGPLLAIDLGIVVTMYLAALVVRFDGAVQEPYWGNFQKFLPLAVLTHLVVNYAFGLYGRMWQYASVHEARRLGLAGALATAILVIASTVAPGILRLTPLSVVVMGTTLSFLGFGSIRFQSRLFALRKGETRSNATSVLLFGAGRAGAMVLRDLAATPSLGLRVVAIVDDDPTKLGRTLHGVRILGGTDSLQRLIAELNVAQVLLAIPSATSSFVQTIASICEQAGVVLRVLPSVTEVVGGQVGARDIRDLRIEDLLGREQTEIDMEAVKAILQGRRVLVTGGGGSIGSEICRQICEFDPEQLAILDSDETHIHDVMTDIPSGVPVLADIRDADRMQQVFRQFRPDVVFHAAALKHVPLLETHPEEALATNVQGTINVALASLMAGTSRFVLISTDKAVNPASVMGGSKRLAEWVMWSLLEEREIFCAVRFGNVLGSRGSVIPTFLRQIGHGGPVTVTDPRMTRYFMSTQEAVRLVLQAAAMSSGGEIFTLDMGDPVNIRDLAERVIRLSGRVPDREIEIVITGPRPGEKITEEIRETYEAALPSAHPSILVSKPRMLGRPELRRTIADLEELAGAGRREELTQRLKAVTPPDEAGAPDQPIVHESLG